MHRYAQGGHAPGIRHACTPITRRPVQVEARLGTLVIIEGSR